MGISHALLPISEKPNGGGLSYSRRHNFGELCSCFVFSLTKIAMSSVEHEFIKSNICSTT